MRAKPNRRKLTELFVWRMKPQPKKFLTWDTQQHGLVLVVEPTGHRSWKCVYRQHSRPRWYHVADASAIGLAEARKLVSTIMYQVAQGADPQAEKSLTAVRAHSRNSSHATTTSMRKSTTRHGNNLTG